MSEEFKREIRYIVFKIKDLDILNLAYRVLELAKISNYARELKNKKPLKCLVIEEDWPEYEIVWQMIEKRMNGDKDEA